MIETMPKKSDLLRGVNFEKSPFLVIWEVTQACDLACRHCRASAQPLHHPLELTTGEGFGLLDEIRRFGRPLFVFTGGDPMKREDLFELIAYASEIGLRVGLSPSGTPLLSYENLDRAKNAGLRSVSISIDGPDKETHDALRNVEGSFRWCMNGAGWVKELGMDLQVNTTVTRFNWQKMDEMAEMVAGLNVSRWSLFFLVPTGRGKPEDEITANEYELVLNKLYDFSKQYSFRIKTTEAPHYRRVVIQQMAQEMDISVSQLIQETNSGKGRFLPGINDGKGFVFVSHTGSIFPSGFLPASGGNVRENSLVDVYRNSPIFQALRNPDLLKGKCGRCAFRSICGGSRSRAFAVTGDFLNEDPYCAYEPETETLS
ncbi:antilisterial bacteriocin subtilosin biosynthesis protein AlbA [bacterium BMS3Abin05]|nr:antilisterial bacteriocin subtilosin biosynthesis protein AlbA [bacterium BMS3Abin05]GBE28408.1 antilisterial bacteriocin subtilosin biosynthesis protein AlbA [bacterium BMS3Bbin03]